jgi:hypothetical protein
MGVRSLFDSTTKAQVWTRLDKWAFEIRSNAHEPSLIYSLPLPAHRICGPKSKNVVFPRAEGQPDQSQQQH